MKTKAFFMEFSVIFLITFVVASIVSYCWNFFSEGVGACSWNIAFQFAILFAILCPMLDLMKSENNQPQ
jgi:hypothetical protein